jgi:hypothetical protein
MPDTDLLAATSDEATTRRLVEEAITLRNIGPIHDLSIPIRPGVTVLCGPNESGKSVTLEAMSRLIGGNAPVTCRDGSASGQVEGLGVKISVRQSARRSGELEALTIEGRLSIADLVDPKIKDPVAADRQRIKALLQLTGATADIGMFLGIGGLEDSALNALVSSESRKSDDLVEMAARIKRDLEAASRREADAAEKEEAIAIACKQATVGIDVNIATNPDTLQASLEDAIYHQGKIAEKVRAAKETQERSRLAVERMKSTPPVNIQGATRDLENAAARMAAADIAVDRLRREMEAAVTELSAARTEHQHAEECLNLERSHAEAIAGWRETIAAGESVECPDEVETGRAALNVNLARQAVEQAAVVRAAQAKERDGMAHAEEAKRHRRAADSLRDAAHGTDDILSAAVASDSLKVRGGRLITQHPDRGEVFFGERSDGMRWKLAIDEAVKRIRDLGADKTAIIPVPQAAWSELDPQNKAAIHSYAVAKNVCIVTAEATDGNLRAEAFR